LSANFWPQTLQEDGWSPNTKFRTTNHSHFTDIITISRCQNSQPRHENGSKTLGDKSITNGTHLLTWHLQKPAARQYIPQVP
jgi:hypothetical protein